MLQPEAARPIDAPLTIDSSLSDTPGGLSTRLWRSVGSVPVAYKVFGLVALPLLLIAAVIFGYIQFVVLQGVLGGLPSTHPGNFVVAELQREVILVYVGAAALGVAASLALTALMLRPLRELVAAMHRVENGDLTARSRVWADDEIGAVQRQFNAMVASLAEAQAALGAQRAAAEALLEENRHLLAEVSANSGRLQQLLRHATSAQEAERRRLARELHDETGQALTSILLRLKVLQDETDVDVIHDRLNGLRYLTSQTLEEVRRISMDLRPTALDDLGLVPAIRAGVTQYAERGSIDITLTAPTGLGRLSPEVEIVLYRAVQEGLTNVMRHAQARRAWVTLERRVDCVHLSIIDDGIGLDPARRGNGLGLEGMRERVLMAGGTLRVDAPESGGTRVVIEIPVGDDAVERSA